MADTNIIDEIRQAIEGLNYGSVEVIVQDGQVTQISTRIIKKTNVKNTAPKITGRVQKAGKSGININFKY
ncbi:MAG: YezD family protein [Candidatus Levybacteria bacterium]|nr:YezD family protein [Candidatus Levybacteria bacterium]